jgi:hypothetical protein
MDPSAFSPQVYEPTDNGLGNIEGSLSWAIKKAHDGQTDDERAIHLQTNVRLALSSDLKRMKTLIHGDVSIEGNGFSISGDNNNNGTVDTNGEDRPLLFILDGNVTLNNLTLTNGVAKGGDGSGGGAGMGGALFIARGTVTVNNVNFTNNRAIGGNASIISSRIGGGGLGGDGSPLGGGGGFAGNANNSSGGYGGNSRYSIPTSRFEIFPIGFRREYNFLENFGFGSQGSFSTTKTFGTNIYPFRYGKQGKFGGGGGGIGGVSNGHDRGVVGIGGDGGFGGGGGAAGRGLSSGGNGYNNQAFNAGAWGGDGGFGGGGGYGAWKTKEGKVVHSFGGFGGGDGGLSSGSGYGGGGAGFGGAVFIREGNLFLNNTTFSNNQAVGALGSNPTASTKDDGKGLGGAIFAFKDLSLDRSTSSRFGVSKESTQGFPFQFPHIGFNNVTYDNNTAANDNNTLTNNDNYYGPNGNLQKGTPSNDLIIGQNEIKEVILADDGDDTVSGESGTYHLHGQKGNDLLSGGTNVDYLYGGEGNDTLSGGADTDWLIEDNGDNLLLGGFDSDFLIGGYGNDTLDGGSSIYDTLVGRDGSDIFVLHRGNTQNLIRDFKDGIDRFGINLSEFNAASVTNAFNSLTIGTSGNAATIKNGSDLLATVFNTKASDITAADFIAIENLNLGE